MRLRAELASEGVVGRFANFAPARLMFTNYSGAAIEGARFIERNASRYFGKSVLETGGRRGLCSLRELMGVRVRSAD
jgi:hypothetical protein